MNNFSRGTYVPDKTFVPIANGKFVFAKDLFKVLKSEKIDRPIVYNGIKYKADKNQQPMRLSKFVKLCTNLGGDVYGNANTTIAVLDKVLGLCYKKITDVKSDDLVVKHVGYFEKNMTSYNEEKTLKSLSYLVGLWKGKGGKFYKNRPCVRISNDKESELLNILDGNVLVDEIERNNDKTTTVIFNNKFSKKRGILNESRAYSLYELLGLVKGLFDGCGYLFNIGEHYDIGLKLQYIDYDLCNAICTVLQSIGVNCGKTSKYRVLNGNSMSEHIDITIYGKRSYENFLKYVGFRSSAKTKLLNEMIESMEYKEYIPSFIGPIIDTEINDVFDEMNTESSLLSFIDGKTNLTRDDFMNYFSRYVGESKIIEMVLDGCYFSTIAENLIVYAVSNSYGFDMNDGEVAYMGSCFVKQL